MLTSDLIIAVAVGAVVLTATGVLYACHGLPVEWDVHRNPSAAADDDLFVLLARCQRAEDEIELVRCEAHRAMQQATRPHLPQVRWRRVSIPDMGATGLLAEVIARPAEQPEHAARRSP